MKTPTNTLKLSSILFIVLLAYSCGSDDGPTPEPEPQVTCNIVEFETGGDITQLDYNSEGKIRSITYSDGSARTLVYSGNEIIINTDGSDYTQTITLNAEGLPINVFSENPSLSDWANYDYEYEGEQLVKATFTTESTTTPVEDFFKWDANGNMVAQIDGTDVITFEYFTDQPVQQGDYVQLSHLIEFGTPLLRNTNLIKSIDYGSGSVLNFDYEFDEDGKITKMIGTDSSGTIEFNYTYECE